MQLREKSVQHVFVCCIHGGVQRWGGEGLHNEPALSEMDRVSDADSHPMAVPVGAIENEESTGEKTKALNKEWEVGGVRLEGMSTVST